MTPLVVNVEDLSEGGKARYAFRRSPVRIGRSELNDIPLVRPYVSNWHAVVQFDEHEIQYVDLGSMNGSFVNGARVERNVANRLNTGAEVRIGTLLLTFELRTTAEEMPGVRPATLFSTRAADLAAVVSPPATPHTPPPEAAPPPIAAEAAPAVPPEVVERALEPTAIDLDLLYASYRATWDHLRSRLDEVTATAEEPLRAALVRRLVEKYPAIGGEESFQSTSGVAAPPPVATSAPARAPDPKDAAVTALVRAFTDAYCSKAISSRDEVEAFLGRLAEALETFSRAYIELRKGFEEFGKEMGLRTVASDGAVQRTRDARQLVAWLLDPAHKGRADELQGAFADLMVHQVALLNGVAEGARAILKTVSPETISASVPQSLWPMRAQNLWKAYDAAFHEIYDEDGAISDLLFGSEFAKAYATIVGRRVASDDDGDEDEPRPSRRKAGRR